MPKTLRALVVVLAVLGIAASASAQSPYPVDRYLRVRHAFAPTFNPSASQVAFLTNTTGNYQVWSVAAEGGWPRQLSFGEDRVGGVAWSPVDPTRLVFAMDKGGNERSQLYLLTSDGSVAEDLTADPDHIYNLGGFSRDGTKLAYATNRRAAQDFDVYVMDLATREARVVFEKGGWCEPAGFSPDGTKLLVRVVASSYDADLYLVDLATGKARHLTPHKEFARYEDAQWLPDGSGFYLRTDQDAEFLSLARYDLARKRPAVEPSPAWDVEDLALSEDGRRLAVVTNENGVSRPRVRDLVRGGEVDLPPLPAGRITDLSFSRDGEKLLFAFSDPTRVTDVWTVRLATGKLVQVTQSSTGGLPPESFAAPTAAIVPSFDGKQVPVFVYRPAASGAAKRPALLLVHGGPEEQARAEFSWIAQYFVGRGFVVVVPNVRGSAGYGREYLHADDVEKRLDSVKDLAAVARWTKAQPGVDPGAVGVLGGSYGGYMVLAALTEFPDEFAAGVSIVGIANFVTFLERTGAWRRALREAEYGSLEKDRALLEAISPLAKADRITAPLMLIQGANDPRVPASEAEQMAAAIRARGGKVEYLLYADEGHGLSKLANRLDAYPKMAAFLEKYLGREGQSPIRK
jgi:dipeptidyl aminopeptidase/acylaminoacyl peptidase